MNPFYSVTDKQDTRQAQRLNSTTIAVLTIYGLVVLMIFGSRLVSPSLGGISQLMNVLYLSSFLVICAFGQGLVILVRGLDLSVASMITLGGVLSTTFMQGTNEGLYFIIPGILLISALVGVISGLGVTHLSIPPFIMTMAMGLIVYSVCLGFTEGTPRGFPAPMLNAFMQNKVLGVALPILLMLVFILIFTILQSYSAFGRKLNAVGNNPDAANIAGIAVKRMTISAYAISAACSALAGVLLAAYANGATLRMGDDYLLPSIAAVVVGGSSILGGRGSFLGTVGGALLLTTLSSMLSALGVGQGWKTILEGIVILVALIMLREQIFTGLQSMLKKPN
ncbi:ribose transport system permease protein [Vreelandella subterranea]|uniref:Autoinducer 2 import system permease protein LsrD n=1 Tax=Vreelandella subterranea TaxID=416874 RepID=A0A1H9RQY0_9GAMM|nr:ABC transporter permease [Halomonas subterranea]SER74319.1 ribose transport system permease protein [Halomonas subterranea]